MVEESLAQVLIRLHLLPMASQTKLLAQQDMKLLAVTQQIAVTDQGNVAQAGYWPSHKVDKSLSRHWVCHRAFISAFRSLTDKVLPFHSSTDQALPHTAAGEAPLDKKIQDTYSSMHHLVPRGGRYPYARCSAIPVRAGDSQQ